jgi:hypothetical protein
MAIAIAAGINIGRERWGREAGRFVDSWESRPVMGILSEQEQGDACL